MRMDRLTSKFQLALQDAQSLALGRDNQFIEPTHLMVALLDQEGGTTRSLLTKAGVNVNQLRSKLGDVLDRLPTVSGGDAGTVHVSRPGYSIACRNPVAQPIHLRMEQPTQVH